ncbi:MAG: hypothetical protein ACR2P8_09460, partial [Myxococcota bacterium]
MTQAQDDDAVAQASRPRTVEPAELPRRDETERWVPSLSFFGAALIQDADSSAASRPLYDPLGANSQVPTIRNGRSIQEEICLNGDLDCVRTTASGNDRQVTPLVSASLELMSPGVQSWPGRPRAFVHADAGVSFSRTRNIAREGVPGELQIPPILGGTGSVSPPNVIGQGSTTASWVKTLILNGGLGVAFTADVGERRLRIKPSVEYLREKVQVDGVVKRVAALAPSADPRRTAECTGATLDGCRTIEL